MRAHKKSSFLEDVYTYNDFVHDGTNRGCEKKTSVTSDPKKPYLISEYNGHMYPTKAFDWEEHRVEHALRHVRVLDAAAAEGDIAGSFGWCMFDYNTHKDFGSGDRICYPVSYTHLDVYKRQAFECAHTLKGMLANMGLTPLYDIVVRIVEPLRAGETAGLLPACDELLAARDRLNTLLKETA